ncbi:hypothetical protein ANCCAN_18142 [Ancylostoma caninum]|uniref:Receptor L-domain domain-containing protein n=1 Tax=Ancylostoma caninum TaxID=29170 RepID=A0A368G099_ANCCA|nr:hypothetical protein ANCCAN_18142 [Ancylostoma caninum]
MSIDAGSARLRHFVGILCGCLHHVPFPVNVALEAKHCGEISVDSTHGHEIDYKDCSTASSLHIVGSNLSSLSAFGNLQKILQKGGDVALTISHNKNLIWEMNSLSSLREVVRNATLSAIPTIAIYDNPKLCIPQADVVRLKEAAGALANDNTFIQECREFGLLQSFFFITQNLDVLKPSNFGSSAPSLAFSQIS